MSDKYADTLASSKLWDFFANESTLIHSALYSLLSTIAKNDEQISICHSVASPAFMKHVLSAPTYLPSSQGLTQAWSALITWKKAIDVSSNTAFQVLLLNYVKNASFGYAAVTFPFLKELFASYSFNEVFI